MMSDEELKEIDRLLTDLAEADECEDAGDFILSFIHRKDAILKLRAKVRNELAGIR